MKTATLYDKLTNLSISHRIPLNKSLSQLGYDYYIEDNSGKVYSNLLSIEDLNQIRRTIYSSFFTMPVILRILKKLIIYRFLTVGRLYKIIIHMVRKKIQKTAKKWNLNTPVKKTNMMGCLIIPTIIFYLF